MSADPVALVRLIRDVTKQEVQPLADDFGDGIVAVVEGGYASIAKGGPETAPTAGFFIVPGLEVSAGDHVFFLDRGPYHLLLANLSRPGFLPEGVTLTDATLAGSLTQTGILSPPALAANTNDWAPDGIEAASIVRLDLTAAFDLTGMQAAPDGTVRELANVSAFTATLKHDVTSAQANRFLCPTAADYALPRNASAVWWYDGVSSRWRLRGK